MTEPTMSARDVMARAGIDLDAFDAALAEAREQATPSLVRADAAEAAADALCTLLLAGAVVPDAADYLAAKQAADTWRAVR